MGGVQVYKKPLQQIPFSAVITVSEGAEWRVEVRRQDAPTIKLYETRVMSSFIHAWCTVQWVSRVACLRKTTLDHIAYMIAGGRLEAQDRYGLARDFDKHEDDFVAEVRHYEATSPEPETLQEIMCLVPDTIRRDVKAEACRIGWLKEREMSESSCVQEVAPPSLPSAATSPRSNGRFASFLRNFFQHG